MPKESKLRKRDQDWEPRGTGRDLYDPDTMPQGCDPDIWHLSLYFRQRYEEYCEVVENPPGMPVIYGNIKRVLTNLPPPDIRTRARTGGITVNWVIVVERTIDYFFNYYDYDYNNVLTTFTSITTFEYNLTTTIEILEREKLINTGSRVVQPEREVKPSKRTEEERERIRIINKKYTEQELEDKMREFKNR